ncbi:MAG TPA: ABC transporter ATP-binding protein [Candidatus Onthovivens sp.]|nr:ABC transporter ATP-binding protein [Candidatus Onthovivens sp.]
MIRYYLFKNKRISFLVILFTLLQALFGAGFAVIFEKFIDYATRSDQESFITQDFIIIAVLLLVYIILFTLINFLRRYFRAGAIVQIDRNVKTDYFNKLFELDLMNYQKTDTGHYLSRFTEDLPTIISEYIIEFFNLLLYIFQAIFTIAVAFYINWIIAIVFLVLSFTIVIYTSFFEKKFKTIREDISKRNSEYLIDLKSFLNGFDSIKLQKAEAVFLNKYDSKLKPVNKAKKKWWLLEAIYSPGTAFLTLSLTFASIVLATFFYIEGMITIGLLTAAIYLSTQIFNPISNIFEQITYLKANKSLSELIFDEISYDNSNQIKLDKKIKTISLKNTSLKYENAQEYILEDLNLNITMGKKYLLIGKSGIGKSTFLKLLIGKLNYEGSIEVNSIELSKIDKSSLFDQVSYVSQNPYIFNDTILNNVDMMGIHSLSEVQSVIEKVNLKDFVEKKGINTYISEEISEISGGEKQRICLARALINKPQILLLDEVTASLDKETSLEIEKLITNLDMTLFYVCHKISDQVLKEFDYVIDFNEKNLTIKKTK